MRIDKGDFQQLDFAARKFFGSALKHCQFFIGEDEIGKLLQIGQKDRKLQFYTDWEDGKKGQVFEYQELEQAIKYGFENVGPSKKRMITTQIPLVHWANAKVFPQDVLDLCKKYSKYVSDDKEDVRYALTCFYINGKDCVLEVTDGKRLVRHDNVIVMTNDAFLFRYNYLFHDKKFRDPKKEIFFNVEDLKSEEELKHPENTYRRFFKQNVKIAHGRFILWERIEGRFPILDSIIDPCFEDHLTAKITLDHDVANIKKFLKAFVKDQEFLRIEQNGEDILLRRCPYNYSNSPKCKYDVMTIYHPQVDWNGQSVDFNPKLILDALDAGFRTFHLDLDQSNFRNNPAYSRNGDALTLLCPLNKAQCRAKEEDE